MRAVIYTRVSADKSSGRSVAEQEQECRRDCDRNGWPVAEVISDNDVGASRWSKGERVGYQRLSGILQRGDVLVTWEASRAQRDLEAYVDLRNLCAERGVRWCYSGRTYDLSTGSDRFSTGLDALLAEKSSEETRERVLRAVRANAAAGRWSGGRPPFGYRLRQIEGGKFELEIDPDRAPLVVEAAERVLKGESLRSILKDWTARGITQANGKPVTRMLLGPLLVRPVYCGRRVHKGALVPTPGQWEAIFSEETHRRLVALLGDSARRVTPVPLGREPLHLLTGAVARCAICDGPMAYGRYKSQRDQYRCRDAHVAQHAERLDRYVEDELVLPVLRAWQADVFLFTDDSDEIAAEAKAEARQLRSRLDDFVSAAGQGVVSVAILGRIESELVPRIEALEKKAVAAHRDPLLSMDLHAAWKSGELETKRRIIKLLFDIRIKGPGRGARSFDPATVIVDPKLPGIAEILASAG